MVQEIGSFTCRSHRHVRQFKELKGSYCRIKGVHIVVCKALNEWGEVKFREKRLYEKSGR